MFGFTDFARWERRKRLTANPLELASRKATGNRLGNLKYRLNIEKGGARQGWFLHLTEETSARPKYHHLHFK